MERQKEDSTQTQITENDNLCAEHEEISAPASIENLTQDCDAVNERDQLRFRLSTANKIIAGQIQGLQNSY